MSRRSPKVPETRFEPINLEFAPPLPDRGYQTRVFQQMRDYRADTGLGPRKLARELLDRLGSCHRDVDAGWLHVEKLERMIGYWLDEGGFAKNARAFYLIEQFTTQIQNSARTSSVLENILQIGRTFADFFGTAAIAKPKRLGLFGSKKPLHVNPEDGVFVYTLDNLLEVEPAPTEFLIIHDVNEPDFLMVQILECEWRDDQWTPVIDNCLNGYWFYRANPSRLLLRNPQNSETHFFTPTLYSVREKNKAAASGFLKYAYSLREMDRDDNAESSVEIDCWKTEEWKNHLDIVHEVSGYRLWDLGLEVAHRKEPPGGSMMGRVGGMASYGRPSDMAQHHGTDGRSDDDVEFPRRIYVPDETSPPIELPTTAVQEQTLPDLLSRLLPRSEISMTPLHRAAYRGDLNAVRQTLATADLTQRDSLGRRPIELACASGNHELIALLDPTNNSNGSL
ncbi:MAG: hypothetical protein AAGJ70_09095 [Pseudomonadota bacterium]